MPVHKQSLPPKLQALINNPEGIDLAWIKSGKSSTDYIFVTAPLEIDADPETVFNAAKKVDRYHDISGGAVSAVTDGDVVPGHPIKLQLYKDKLIGKFIPPVTETIIVAGKVNDDWVIGWGLPLPFGEFTQRYQLLEALSNHRTRSTIGDKIPSVIGFFSRLTLDKTIKNAFKDLNEGLKRDIETRNNKI